MIVSQAMIDAGVEAYNDESIEYLDDIVVLILERMMEVHQEEAIERYWLMYSTGYIQADTKSH